MKIIRVVFLLSLLIGLAIFAGYQYPDQMKGYYNGAVKKIKAIKLSLFPYKDEYFEYMTVEEVWQVINWLNTGEYDQLDNFFTKLTKQYESDYKYETRLDNAYESFKYINNVEHKHFDQWVEKDANNPIALTARAYYLIAKGWDERGNAFINKTSQEQLDKMHVYMALAEKDVKKVISISNKTAIPYSLLLEIAMVAGESYMRNEYFIAGIKASPGSYIIREKMLGYLRSVWGGSDTAMKNFAANQQKYIEHNPGLKRLQARWFFMKANNYYSKNIHKSIALHTKALTYDRYWKALRFRGELYIKQKKYDLAIDDLTESYMRNPYSYKVHTERAYAYIQTKQYKLAEDDLLYAMKYWPDRFRAYYLYTSVLKNTNRHDKALLVIEHGKKAIPEKMAAWLNRQGRIYLDLKQYKDALNVFQESVAFDPDNSYAWTEISLIYQHKIRNDKLAVDAAKNALSVADKHYNLYNYGTALYRNKDRLALEVYRAYLERCSRVTCDNSRLSWTKRFMACVNKEKSCDFDRHDYEEWL